MATSGKLEELELHHEILILCTRFKRKLLPRTVYVAMLTRFSVAPALLGYRTGKMLEMHQAVGSQGSDWDLGFIASERYVLKTPSSSELQGYGVTAMLRCWKGRGGKLYNIII